MQFKEVIGHEAIKQQLIKSVQDGRVSHAQLFLGPEGSGALPLAFAFAQYILCQNKMENDACGNCTSCTKAQKIIHPDLHFSFPVITVPNKKTPPVSNDYITKWREFFLANPYLNINDWLQNLVSENKQGNITVEECHDIIRKLSLKSFEDGFKILIMWMPEYLGNAGNTLLKLIEEPPADTLIILVAEDQEKILNTILSRTQLLKTGKLSNHEIARAIVEREGIDEKEATSLAQLADGNFSEAMRLIQNKGDDHAEIFISWMRTCLKPNGKNFVDFVDQAAAMGRENQKNFFKYGLILLREGVIAANVSNYQPMLSESEVRFVKYLKDNLSLEQMNRLNEIFNKSHYYIERNANPKILFLDLSIRINKILNNIPVEVKEQLVL